MILSVVDKLTRCQNQLDDLTDCELQTEGGTDYPEKTHQYTHHQSHIQDLSSLALAQQAVYAIEEVIHRRSMIVVRVFPLSST